MLDQMSAENRIHRPCWRARQARQGMTLIELLLSVAIVAVLMAVAVPSMYEFIMRKKVEGAADELLTDLRYARSMVVKSNRRANIKFSTTKTEETCYVVFHPTSMLGCNCASTPVCSTANASAAVELKTVRFPASGHVTVTPTTGSSDMLQFDSPSGLPSKADTIDITIKAPSGGEVRLTTSQTGRPQICSVSGHASAYPACPTK